MPHLPLLLLAFGLQDPPAPPGMLSLPALRAVRIGSDPRDIERINQEHQGRYLSLVDETPAHEVRVEAFHLMITEVTGEQFEAYVRATGAQPPVAWAGEGLDEARDAFLEEDLRRREAESEAGVERPQRGVFDKSAWWDANWEGQPWELPEGERSKPVTSVSFREAEAYARWAGLRLMTEVEYQRAVRGDSDRLYPWGEKWEDERAACLETTRGVLAPVGSFPKGVSEDGLHDLAGNAWEWTATRYLPYEDFEPFEITFQDGENRRTEERLVDWYSDKRVAVGGGAAHGEIAARATTRREVSPSQRLEGLGFRCAASMGAGLDNARHVERTGIPRSELPVGVTYDPELATAMDRWESEAGTVEVPGYALITGYDHLSFIPVEEIDFSTVKDLKSTSVDEDPVHLGLFSTTLALTEPALEPGTYMVVYRGPGEPKKKRQKDDEEEQAPPTLGERLFAQAEGLFDPEHAHFLFLDAERNAMAALRAPDPTYDRMRAGKIELRQVLPPEDPEERIQEDPGDLAIFEVSVKGSSSRGFVFNLPLQTDLHALHTGHWRR